MAERFPRTEIEQSIPQRFARCVEEGPDRLAVITDGQGITYRRLDEWSNAIAAELLERFGTESEPIPFAHVQGPLAIATTLGILKAGKFYVPIDPSWTPERTAAVVANLSARAFLTSGALAKLARERLVDVTVVEPAEGPPSAAVAWPARDVRPDEPAYVYFTSGSTGHPKGVLDNHRNVLHNVMRYTNALDITDRDRLSLVQPCAFSGAVSSMFAALLNGGAACPLDVHAVSPARLADWIDACGITIYHSVPSLFRSFMLPGRTFPTVRVVRLEGDRAARLDLELFRQHFEPPCQLAVGLGATETGLVCQYFFDHSSPMPDGVVPIGRPVPDVRVEVLRPDGSRCAPDETGEIVVQSRFLAPGYWRNPSADARAFGAAQGAPDERSYRTGDLGRMRADGMLEHLGRLDGRVRIRGQWADLADIEAALASIPGVREAAVKAVEGDGTDPVLHAYYVPGTPPSPSVGRLRQALAERLEPPMVPTRFVALDRLPLNANGKVDRALLPEPTAARPALDDAPVEPVNLVQRRLCLLWEDMLGIAPVGLRDDFFDLGGHSLLAVAMMDRVEDLFGRRVPLSLLLGGATVERISTAVLDDVDEMLAPVVPLRRTGGRPPFFFFHGDYLAGGMYCLELARRLHPDPPFHVIAPSGYDGQPIPRSYEEMAERHLEAIRAVQPRGPYFLGGMCNGGLVALEVARLIQESGDRVGLVLEVGASAANVRLRPLRWLIGGAGAVLRLPQGTRRYLFGRLHDFLANQAGLSWRERVRYGIEKMRVAYKEIRAVAGRDAPAGFDDVGPGTRSSVEARREITRAYTQIDHAYVPSRYRGSIALLWPREDAQTAAEAARHWLRVSGDVEVVEIPGEHLTCLTRYVGDLGAAIQHVLDLHADGAPAAEAAAGDERAPTPGGPEGHGAHLHA